MPNLQSLLPPVSALGNQSGAMSSTARTALDTQRNSSETADISSNEDLNAEQSFSQLLDDSSGPKSLETDKYKQDSSDEFEMSSSSLSGFVSAELDPLGGNILPFEGQTLPPSTAIVVEDLAEGFYQISANLQDSTAFSNSLPADSFGIGLESETTILDLTKSARQALGETALSALLADDSKLASITDIDAAGSLPAGLGVSELTAGVSLTNSQAEPASDAQLTTQISLSDIELDAADAGLLQSREILSGFNTEQASDPSARASQISSSAAAPSMNLTGATNPDEIKQGRSKGVDFLNALDTSNSDQGSEAEFSKFEGITSNQSSRAGEKSMQMVSGNTLAPGAADASAGLVQNPAVSNSTSLTNALSQWRVDQDSNAVNTDPLERQGFTKLSVPFNQSGWGENLGRQLSLLLAKNMDSAQIQLDPPELGPLGVKIQINQDQVSLQFTSGHAVVREALEQSSQRLQQMLNEEGLELVDVGVSDQNFGQNNDSSESDEKENGQSKLGESALDRNEESDGLLTPARKLTIDDGNIDYFI